MVLCLFACLFVSKGFMNGVDGRWGRDGAGRLYSINVGGIVGWL